MKKKEHFSLTLEEIAKRYKSDSEFRKQVARKNNRPTATHLLVIFAQEGDLKWVQEVLNHNIPINGKYQNVSALFIACERGHIEMCRYLLKQGASADLRCVDGQTAVMRAVIKENIELLRLLLEHGVQVNIQDDYGMTALHYASETSNLEFALNLLRNGASANVYDKAKYSPLIVASERGNLGLVQELISRGVQLNDKNRQGTGALVRAVAGQREEIVELFLEQGIDVNDQWNRLSPLHAALVDFTVPRDLESALQSNVESILQSNSESMQPPDIESMVQSILESMPSRDPKSRPFNARILELLIHHGADPLAPGGAMGWSALNSAAVMCDTGVVELLLSTGIDPNEVSAPGVAPLEHACKAGRMDMASLLLERGSDVELKNREGQTCLFHAVWSGSIDLVKFLIGKGASANTKDKRGTTPLAVAVSHDDLEMVTILVEAGADVNATVGENSNILELASQLKAESVIGFLIDSGARFPEEIDEAGDSTLLAQEGISRAAHTGDFKQALEFLQRLDDPEAADSNAATILKAATGNRDLLIIDQILNEYPKVKIEDALTVAAEKGDLELLNIYLEKNLSSEGLQSRISFGPALRAAVRKGHLQAFELLRKRSTDLQTDSELRHTLIVIAASEANVKATKRLLDLGIGQDAGTLNSGGMRALRLAVLEENEKIINLLLQAGSLSLEDIERQSDPVMVISAIRNDIHLAKKLANRGADINATGRNGFTALMTAANRGHTEIAKLLLMRGADINLKDDRGRTALDHAIGRNRIEIIRLLKASGAKPAQDMD